LVVANRLTEVDNVKVLVLEAGTDESSALIDIPGLVPFTQLTSFNWGYKTVPQKHACKAMQENKSHWPRGKVVGGTSCLNFLVYTRGNSGDFDSWQNLGAEGWNYEEVLPYFKKSENMTTVDNSGVIDSDFHGNRGLLKTSSVKGTPIHDVMVDSMNELGFEEVDYNGKNQQGFSHIQSTKHSGVRQTSANTFLYPFLESRKKQLHLLTRAHVKKVEFDEKAGETPRAVGVRYVRDGREHVVKVSKEVIVSGGSVATPQILMLSGIGDAQHLRDVGIPVVADLPGVGSNLQDHVMIPGCMKAENIPNQWLGAHMLNPFYMAKEVFNYVMYGEGYLTSAAGHDSHGFFSTPAKNITKLGDRPDLQILVQGNVFPTIYPMRKIYEKLFNYNEKTTNNMKEWSAANSDSDMCDLHINSVLLHPDSIGSIRLKSSDYLDHPLIDPNYLSDIRDVNTLIEGFRLIEKMEDTEALKQFNAKLMLYSPECGSETESPRSDKFYECYIRKFTWTVYHPVGTAKIGSKEDPMAVVDPSLSVYKVNNLRVADASVMPEITSGNTQAPCYMIGEKVSNMIKEKWKLV